MTALLFVAAAMAHGDSFELVRLSARPEAPEELWGVVDGWGIVHSEDGGQRWGWLCEEAIGSTAVYDVLAWQEGSALLGTVDGLLQVDDTCIGQSVGGLPEGFVLTLARRGEEAMVALVGSESGGVYRCGPETCVATSLVGAGYFPKSIVVDGDTVWATVVHTGSEEGLAAELWTSADGQEFTVAHAWPDGDVDPRVIHAQGASVYTWLRPRTEATLPGFAWSADGGATFTTTFTTGYYTDPTPGFLVTGGGGTVLIGSWYGARTWRSVDAGGSFEEVSLEAPALRCGLAQADRALVCTDHLVDGFDIAATTDGVSFSPELCLEEVEAAACVTETCAPYADSWRAASALGGGRCQFPDDAGETPDDPPCGCAEGGGSANLLPLGAAGLLAARRRRRLC